MGNWSPYSQAWEKQRVEKTMDQLNARRSAFEKKPKLLRALVRFCQTIAYYGALWGMHLRMVFDRKYREEARQSLDGMEEKMLRRLADIAKDGRKD